MLFSRTLVSTALLGSLALLVDASAPGGNAHLMGAHRRHHARGNSLVNHADAKLGRSVVEADAFALENAKRAKKDKRRCKPRETPTSSAAPEPTPDPVADVAPDPEPAQNNDDNNNNNNDDGGDNNNNDNNDDNGGDNNNDDNGGGSHHHGGGGGGGGGETFTGEATFYGAGETACGPTYSTSDYIGALAFDQFDMFGSNGNPNQSPMCGRSVTAHYQGNSVTIQIVDKCEGCKWGDIDFTPSAFEQLASKDKGRLYGMTWSFD